MIKKNGGAEGNRTLIYWVQTNRPSIERQPLKDFRPRQVGVYRRLRFTLPLQRQFATRLICRSFLSGFSPAATCGIPCLNLNFGPRYQSRTDLEGFAILHLAAWFTVGKLVRDTGLEPVFLPWQSNVLASRRIQHGARGRIRTDVGHVRSVVPILLTTRAKLVRAAGLEPA